MRTNFLRSIGLLGLGAALMYALDPSSGHRRRALGKDKALKQLRHTRRRSAHLLRHGRNVARGRVVSRLHHLRQNPVSDEVLTARVRSKIGRVVENAHSVHVDCADGIISLRGRVPAELRPRILSSVESVRGVRQVTDHLISEAA